MPRCFRLLLVTAFFVCLGCGDGRKSAVEPQPQVNPPKGPPGGEAPSEMETLLASARDPDAKVRLRAIRALGQHSGKSVEATNAALPTLVELLKHADPLTRGGATDALVEIGDAPIYRKPDLQGGGNPLHESKTALPALVETLGNPVGVRARHLGQIAEYNLPAAKKIIEAIGPLLKSEQAGIRAAAAEAVLHMARRLDRTRQGLLKDKIPHAAALAGPISDLFIPVATSLKGLSEDPSAEVRKEANAALNAILALRPQEAEPKLDTPQKTVEAARTAAAAKEYRAYYACFTPEAQELMAGSFMIKSKLMLMMAPNSPDWIKRRANAARETLMKHGLTKEDVAKIRVTFKRDEEERQKVRKLAAPIKDRIGFVADMMAAEDFQPDHQAMPEVVRLEDVKIQGETATLTLVGRQGGAEQKYAISLRRIAERWRISEIAETDK